MTSFYMAKKDPNITAVFRDGKLVGCHVSRDGRYDHCTVMSDDALLVLKQIQNELGRI